MVIFVTGTENHSIMAKIIVKDTSVTIISVNENDYISLTDIAKYKSDDPTAVIGNWLRNRNTIEYLGIWESLYNPNFKAHMLVKHGKSECRVH